jgi:hypothetical protein
MIYRQSVYPITQILWEYGDGSDEFLLPDGSSSIYNKYDGSEFNSTRHVTLVKNSTNKTVSIYINGYLKEVLSYINEPSGGTSTSFFIGGAAVAIPSETLTMSMGHFALFQRVLTPQEVVELTKASGFMPEEYEFGDSEFEVLEESVENFATLQSIKETTEYSADKLLTISLDPLIDPSLVAGSEAYTLQ